MIINLLYALSTIKYTRWILQKRVFQYILKYLHKFNFTQIVLMSIFRYLFDMLCILRVCEYSEIKEIVQFSASTVCGMSKPIFQSWGRDILF